MIERLTIQNFKCFEALSLPLAPLTLMTGFNAAGKSTALQTLLLLSQSIRHNL
jgi:predicted ATPase